MAQMALTKPDVFMSVPGAVLVVGSKTPESKIGFFAHFHVDGGSQFSTTDGSAYNAMRSIISSISISEATNSQFLTSLNKVTYLYTFGDRLAELDVGGVFFLNPECDGVSGFHAVYNFFEANKLSTNNIKPIKFVLSAGGDKATSVRTFNCFLVSSNFSITDPAAMVGTYSLKLYYMPQPK
jgi:hypothetical protein